MSRRLSFGDIRASSRFLGRILIDRRLCAVLVFLLIASLFVGAAIISFQQEPLSVFLNLGSLYFEPKSFRIVVESFDSVSDTVHVRAGLTFKKGELDWNDVTHSLFKDPDAARHANVVFGPLTIGDLGKTFDVLGLAYVQQGSTRQAPRPDSGYAQSPPGDVAADLLALGDPRLYPYDSYLVMGRVSCPVWATPNGVDFVAVPGEHYSFDLRLPGFVIREAHGADLRTWPTFYNEVELPRLSKNGGRGAPVRAADRFDANVWERNQFALVLERPLFLRLSAGFLCIVALLSTIYVALQSKPGVSLVNAVAYFIGLWAVRQTLAVGAPSVATLLDYSIMALYSLFLALTLATLIWRTRGARPKV